MKKRMVTASPEPRFVSVKQFIPEGFCLKCQGCCRFAQEDSVWVPCLLDEEIQDLLDKKDIPAVSLSIGKRIHPVAHPGAEGFICPLLNIRDNKCRIYAFRPFECQLYPFLISLRHEKVLLTVDLNCAYIRENLNRPDLNEYIQYLTSFLNSPEQLRLLKGNPHIIQAYEEALDIIELGIPDETQ